MKYTNIILFSLIFLSVLSCQEDILRSDDPNNVFGGTSLEYTAAIEEDGDTKAVVNPNGYYFWETGDNIKVYGTSGSSQETRDPSAFKPINNTSNAIFTLDLNGFTPSFAIFPSNLTIGRYAADGEGYAAGDLQTVTLPSSYGTEAEPYTGKAYAPMYATVPADPETANVNFKHLCGMMKITIAEVPVGTNQLVFTADGNIAGTFNVTTVETHKVLQLGDINSTVEGAVEGSKTITFNFTAPASEAESRTFYIPLPIGSYDSFKIELNKVDEATSTVTTVTSRTANTKGRKITRSKLAIMPSPTFDYMLIDNTYYVYTAKGLQTVNTIVVADPTLNVTLKSDILLSSATSNWTTIENYSGTFDGGGFSIIGLSTNRTNGLITTLTSDGVVKDLTLANCMIDDGGLYLDGFLYLGGFVGVNYGKIISCTLTSGEGYSSTVTKTNLSGNWIGYDNSIGDYYYSSYGIIGGIVGLNKGEVIGCSVEGAGNTNIITSPGIVGGIVGENNGGIINGCEIRSSGNSGILELRGACGAGGIVGRNRANSNMVSCLVSDVVFKYLSVRGISPAVGLIYEKALGGVAASNAGTITACYAYENSFNSVGSIDNASYTDPVVGLNSVEDVSGTLVTSYYYSNGKFYSSDGTEFNNGWSVIMNNMNTAITDFTVLSKYLWSGTYDSPVLTKSN